MVITRRDFLRYGAIGLGSLVLKDTKIFCDEQSIILPTLEEIMKNFSRTHEEVLEPAIRDGLIKKFGYTRQTKPESLYEFLNVGFKNKIVFVYFDVDGNTSKKNIWGKGTGDERLGAGSSIIFLYTMLNLKKSNSDIGFLFLELKDFYGEENWEKLKRMFDNGLEGFPSYVEFRKTEDGTYGFNHISESSQRDPQTILKWIGEYVEDFRKRTSK